MDDTQKQSEQAPVEVSLLTDQDAVGGQRPPEQPVQPSPAADPAPTQPATPSRPQPATEPPSASPTGDEAIDLTETSRQIQTGIDYVAESRLDFESMGPLDWIATLSDTLTAAKEAVRNLEVTYAESSISDYSVDYGETHDYLVRTEANATDFDTAVALHDRSVQLFQEYFDKHVALVNKQRG